MITLSSSKDEQVDLTLNPETQWFLHALNSHPRNVSDGCIVNLVVVLGRYPIGPSELGFDRHGQEPLPQNIAKLSLLTGKSTQQESSEVDPIEADGHDAKNPKHSEKTIDPDPFGVSKLFTPAGKPLDVNGYGAVPSNDMPIPGKFVQLPPPIPQATPVALDSTSFDNILPIPRKGRKKRDLSGSKARTAFIDPEIIPYRGSKRNGDSTPPYQSEDSSDDSVAIGPGSRKMILAGSHHGEREGSRASTQILREWTNLEQATNSTQASKKRQRRSEKRKQMEKDGYVSLSDEPDSRYFIVGDQVQVRSGNSRDRDSNAKPPPRRESPYDGDRGLSSPGVEQPKKARSKIGEKVTTKLQYPSEVPEVDILSRERDLEEREKDLARRERRLLGVPAPVGPANVEAEAEVHIPRYSSSVESVDLSV